MGEFALLGFHGAPIFIEWERSVQQSGKDNAGVAGPAGSLERGWRSPLPDNLGSSEGEALERVGICLKTLRWARVRTELRALFLLLQMILAWMLTEQVSKANIGYLT